MTQKQRSLVGGISILGIAGLICKIVGVLYRIPLANMIGGEGMGLYQQVFPAYNLLLTISSAGIPVAISRMVSHFVTLQDPRNAKKVFSTAFKMLLLLGILTTAILMALSGRVAAWVGTPEGWACYMCIAPSLLFVCVMSAFRGYMQGMRRMLPTAISQLIEQVGKVAVALPLAYAGNLRGGWVMGAAGALLGTSIAECTAMLYMLLNHRQGTRAMSAIEQMSDAKELSTRFVLKRLLYVSIPITLGACIVPLASTIDSAMLKNLMTASGMADSEARIRYGIYSGLVLALINVPTALAMAMSTNLVPDIAAGMARHDKQYVAQEAGTGMRLAAVIGFPCSIGMSLLAKPILFLCFSTSYSFEQLTLAGELLQFSALTIVLFTMVQASSGILQGVGKQRIPMYTLMAGVACKIFLNYVLVSIPSINIHGAPYASLTCYTVSMIPNIFYVCKYSGYRFSISEILLRPLGASAIMGISVWGVWELVFGGESWLQRGGMLQRALPVVVCILVGVIVYIVSAWMLKAIRREDLPARLQRRFK